MQKLARLVGDDDSIYAARRRREVQSMRELMYDEAEWSGLLLDMLH